MIDVCLIQIDGTLPNHALMQISTHHKALGDRVVLQEANPKKQTFEYPSDMPDPDKIYVSCVFSQNLEMAERIHDGHPDSMLGGPGLGIPNRLPLHIENLMPDYSLYPDMDYSMGFTSRGCIRVCEFCIVPKLEGFYTECAPIQQFHKPEHKKIIILDSNILASSTKKLDEKFTYIEGSLS